MENSTELLEKLAEKLGTTTEYLWEILLDQAIISSITNVIMFVILIITGGMLYKLHKGFSKPISDNQYAENKYDKNEGICVIMIVLTSVWAVFFIVSVFFIGDTINGFVHPEYWALDKILSAIKGK